MISKLLEVMSNEVSSTHSYGMQVPVLGDTVSVYYRHGCCWRFGGWIIDVKLRIEVGSGSVAVFEGDSLGLGQRERFEVRL